MSKFFEFITELIGALQIIASPFLIGLVIGSVIYLPHPTTPRLIIGGVIVLLGLIIGVVWATNIWKAKGTIWFISRIMATPELDKKKECIVKPKPATNNYDKKEA